MRFPAEADRLLVGILRRPSDPEISALARRDATRLFARAETHGLSGVVYDLLRAASDAPVVAPDLAVVLDARALARELDYAAHLSALGRVDAALADAGVRAVALKGPLLAQRLYARPSARATSDIDLLVCESDLEAARIALRGAGWVAPSEGVDEAWSRREHHHIVLLHPQATPLELHFRAYRGFGEKLPSEPLVARARSAGASFRALRVLAPPDELVYLAVHAAAHRYVRIAWLHDLRLLVETMPDAEIATAALRARAWGYARAVALAGELVRDVLGVDARRVRSLGTLDGVRGPIVRGIVAEPQAPVLRSATRFVYTAMLADSVGASMRYARSSSFSHARRLLGLAR